MTYKRLMVAVDGSDTSRLALEEATRFAKSLNASLCVITVVQDLPILGVDLGINLDRYKEIMSLNGLAILDSMKKLALNEGLTIEAELVEMVSSIQKISEKIIETATFKKIDLLVIGTHGRRGFNRVMLGSVAEEVVHISPIPIFLIRANEKKHSNLPYKKIFVAVDGSDTANLALAEAIQLAKTLNTELCIVHVANELPVDLPLGFPLKVEQEHIRHSESAILDKAKLIAQKNGLSPEIHLIEIKDAFQKISEALAQFTSDINADLLVMGTHGLRGFKRFLLGSVAEETVRLASVPIILVRAKG